MAPISYQTVQRLITQEQVDGRTLHVVFTCPVSGHTVPATSTINAPPTASDQVKHRAKRAFLQSVRGPIANAIRQAFGYSTLGRMAGDVASQVAYSTTSARSTMAFSDTQKQAAALDAFRKVESQFVWSEENGGFVATAGQ
ncbi:MAG: hypothetical protein AAF628_01625 [Planctomycetota bacterium]